MPPPADRCDPCCGCVDLKIAALIIGYLQLFGVIGFTAWMIYCTVVVAAKFRESNESDMLLISFYGMAMYLVSILFVFIVVLLFGLHLKKRGWVKAYLTAFVIFMGFAVIAFSLYTKYTFQPEVFYPGIVGFVLSIYFLAVIVGRYREMGVYRSRY